MSKIPENLSSLRKDDSRWVSFSRFVMWGAIFSLLGLFAANLYFPIFAYLGLPLLSLIVAVLFLLAATSGVPLFLYERRRMTEWLAEELDKMPKQSLLTIAQKEGVSIEENMDNKMISQKLMSELKRKIIEKYVFSE